MLKKCCYCLKLRTGCIVISIIDFIFNLAVLNIKHLFTHHIEQAVAICHCIGCFFLLGGALIRANVLLMFYLITSLTNSVILTIFCIYLLVNELKNRETIVPVGAFYICVEIYFWIVVYSFYVQIRPPAADEEV